VFFKSVLVIFGVFEMCMRLVLIRVCWLVLVCTSIVALWVWDRVIMALAIVAAWLRTEK
jgi:hypothetical protein